MYTNDRFRIKVEIQLNRNFSINLIQLSEFMSKSTSSQMSFQRKTFCLIVFFSLIMTLGSCTGPFFCHSNCIDYTSVCFGVTADSCYVCATSIFKDKDYTNPYNPCVPKDQRQILFNDLDSAGALSLNGFSTSNQNTFNCGGMSFAGKFVNTDYLSKNFTGITREHFELVIRFNIAYIGTWAPTDNLQLQIHDGVSSSNHTWGYSCGANSIGGQINQDTQNLCSTQGTDCVRIKEFTIQHNASYVSLKWSSLTTQNDPNVQNWGIKDIMIVAKTCHRYCDKCFGQSVTQCLTCSAGYFLRGNTCVEKCPRLSIPNTQQCADSCPNGYFHNAMNDFCEPCLDGCSLCSGQSHCLLWESQSVSPINNVWYDKMELWIIMIIVGVALIALIVWKFVVKRYFLKDPELNNNSSGSDQASEQKQKNSRRSRIEDNGQLNNVRATTENLTNQLWIVDAENLDPVKVDVRRRKKRKADIDQSMNNSELHF